MGQTNEDRKNLQDCIVPKVTHLSISSFLDGGKIRLEKERMIYTVFQYYLEFDEGILVTERSNSLIISTSMIVH